MASFRLLLIALLLLAPRPAHALLMRVSGLSDIAPLPWNLGDGAITAYTNVCIYAVDVFSLASYTITASSAGGFKLFYGVNAITYTLFWEDSGAGNLGANGGTQMTNGVALSNRHNHNILDAGCAGTGPNARLYLKITQAEMETAVAGLYQGTVTLLLSPT